MYATLFLLSFFLISSIGFSLGVVADWNVLDHLAMVDRLETSGRLYSGPNDFPTMASSNYFPGLSYIILMMSYVIPDGLMIEAMHLLGILVLVYFLFIQLKITQTIHDTERLHFIAFWIFTTVVVLSNWFIYALKFKPDTLAVGIGLTALYLIEKQQSNHRITASIVLLSILVAVPVIFKQQYIAFIAGYIVFALLQSWKYRVSAAITALTTILILYHVASIENAWFWSVTVLADHGLVNLKSWGLEHLKLLIKLTFVFFILFSVAGVSALAPLKKPVSFALDQMKALKQPWAFPLVFASGASFLSGLKAGGNVGNTELSIALLIPFIFIIFSKVSQKTSIAMAALCLMISIPDAYRGVKNYRQNNEAEAFFMNSSVNKGDLIFTISDMYGVTRNKRNDAGIHNWHQEILINKLSDSEIPEFVLANEFDYVILPNSNFLNTVLIEDDAYRLIYQNKNLQILEQKVGKKSE